MSDHIFSDRVVLITGGTGSFGTQFVKTVLAKYPPRKLIVLSRDELKQSQMQERITDARLRFFIGDVRDRERLYRAFDGVDLIVHAAAMKQVPGCEYNPFEAIRTNVIGAQNVIDAAIDRKVRKVVALSSDKAANPINLYGATKLCSDKLFVASNSYSGGSGTSFSVVRYGNVLGSRGSVVPRFRRLQALGKLPITDQRMTRFWITLPAAVEFVVRCFYLMQGGEIFVPKIPSMRIVDLAKAIAPGCETEEVGIRPGEKLHEIMIPEDDARRCLEYDDYYVVQPTFTWWSSELQRLNGGRPLPDGFAYSSDQNGTWLSVAELRERLAEIEAPDASV